MRAVAQPTVVVQDRNGPTLPNLVGVPKFNRRLTDKIGATFKHACSVGETTVAARLRAVPVECEDRSGTVLWTESVPARDAYCAARRQPGADPAMVAGFHDAMKEAHRRWNASQVTSPSRAGGKV